VQQKGSRSRSASHCFPVVTKPNNCNHARHLHPAHDGRKSPAALPSPRALSSVIVETFLAATITGCCRFTAVGCSHSPAPGHVCRRLRPHEFAHSLIIVNHDPLLCSSTKSPHRLEPRCPVSKDAKTRLRPLGAVVGPPMSYLRSTAQSVHRRYSHGCHRCDSIPTTGKWQSAPYAPSVGLGCVDFCREHHRYSARSSAASARSTPPRFECMWHRPPKKDGPPPAKARPSRRRSPRHSMLSHGAPPPFDRCDHEPTAKPRPRECSLTYKRVCLTAGPDNHGWCLYRRTHRARAI